MTVCRPARRAVGSSPASMWRLMRSADASPGAVMPHKAPYGPHGTPLALCDQAGVTSRDPSISSRCSSLRCGLQSVVRAPPHIRQEVYAGLGVSCMSHSADHLTRAGVCIAPYHRRRSMPSPERRHALPYGRRESTRSRRRGPAGTKGVLRDHASGCTATPVFRETRYSRDCAPYLCVAFLLNFDRCL